MSDDVKGQEDRFVVFEARCAEAESKANLAISRCENAEARTVAAEQLCVQSSRRMRVIGSLAVLMCIGAMLISPGNKAIAQGYGESLHQLLADVSTLKTEMSSVQNKTKFMSVSGNTTLFTACNVQIVNGTGATDGQPFIPLNTNLPGNSYFTNGLGNLIIGYNQDNGQPETGSHNLILGDGNGYTSFGGIVAGEGNIITGPCDSVTGGSSNHADGYYSSVTGGEYSQAVNEGASVSGGFKNLATGFDSSVSGGGGNESRGDLSSVTGGVSNIASGESSSCLGGYLCRSDDSSSAVLGGYNSTVDTGNAYSHFPYPSPYRPAHVHRCAGLYSFILGMESKKNVLHKLHHK